MMDIPTYCILSYNITNLLQLFIVCHQQTNCFFIFSRYWWHAVSISLHVAMNWTTEMREGISVTARDL